MAFVSRLHCDSLRHDREVVLGSTTPATCLTVEVLHGAVVQL